MLNHSTAHKIYQIAQEIVLPSYTFHSFPISKFRFLNFFTQISQLSFNSNNIPSTQIQNIFKSALLFFFMFLQKQLQKVFYKKYSWKFHKIQYTPVLESLFNKVASLKACSFIKKSLQRRCFPGNIANFLRTSILQNIC